MDWVGSDGVGWVEWGRVGIGRGGVGVGRGWVRDIYCDRPAIAGNRML